VRYLLLLSLPLLAQSNDAHLKAFQKDVAPFLAKRCVACHNEKLKNADLNLARLRSPQEALAERNVWEDVADKIRNAEMPTTPKPPPNPAASPPAVSIRSSTTTPSATSSASISSPPPTSPMTTPATASTTSATCCP
jgi:hypothetical protein